MRNQHNPGNTITQDIDSESAHIDKGLVLPVHESVDDIPDKDIEIGSWVYLTGGGDRPEGMWRYSSSEIWLSGADSASNTINFAQRDIPNGGTVTMMETSFPSTTQDPDLKEDRIISIWEAQIKNLQGNQTGLRLDIVDTTADETIYQREAGADGTTTDFGYPVATGGTPGNTCRIRLRNTSSQTKSVTGYVTFTWEPLIQ